MWATFDIETTGLKPQEDRVIELACCVDGVVYDWLINPEIEIPSTITALTGINNEMVLEQGVSFGYAWRSFLVIVQECDTLVGHNVLDFDWRFLMAECRRYGIYHDHMKDIRDTAALFKAMKLKEPTREPHAPWAYEILGRRVRGLKYNLLEVARHFQLTVPGDLHRAGADAELTARIYQKLGEQGYE